MNRPDSLQAKTRNCGMIMDLPCHTALGFYNCRQRYRRILTNIAEDIAT